MRSLHVFIGALCGVLSIGSGALARPSKHKEKKPRVVADPAPNASPSGKYGAMTREQCLAELRRRDVKFEEEAPSRGVVIPIRLRGPVGGVTYRTELPASERPTTPYEVFDCRLVLSLDDFGPILKAHDIETALIFSAWRPPAKSWPADKAATRHPGALAVDIRRFVKSATAKPAATTIVASADASAAPTESVVPGADVDGVATKVRTPGKVAKTKNEKAAAKNEKAAARSKKGTKTSSRVAAKASSRSPTSVRGDGTDLVVERDWAPQRDVPPCSATFKVSPDTSEAKELHAIFCEAVEKKLFTSQLGPNYNKPHENHFHLEITPGVNWRLIL